MTGMERRKCIISCNTRENEIIFRGKFNFFIKDEFVKNIRGELFIELENHCHGKRPAIRNNV